MQPMTADELGQSGAGPEPAAGPLGDRLRNHGRVCGTVTAPRLRRGQQTNERHLLGG